MLSSRRKVLGKKKMRKGGKGMAMKKNGENKACSQTIEQSWKENIAMPLPYSCQENKMERRYRKKG